jgi:phosphatidylglycerol---prolipoprotein diacylglyceryl transferase
MLITWNPDPIIYAWNFITIRWYGVFFALTFISGGILGTWILKRESKPPESLDRIMIHMILGTIIGARLGHCLFYEPGFYLSNPLEILKIWRGGLASHGGGIGIMLAIYLYSRKTPGQPFLWILDRVGLASALGCSLIRLGNLFNSEIIGLPTGSNWGVIFSRVDMIPRHPTQVYESLAYFAIFIFLLILYLRKDLAGRHGFLSGATLVTILPARLAIEFLKENQSTFEEGWVLNLGQLLSIPLILLGVYFLVQSFKRKTSPGS